MDKQKQIEEMASDMDYGCVKRDLYPDDAKEIAKALYLLGYRKIPENAVVLTREEWAKRNAEIEIIKNDNDTYLKEAKRVCELELKTRHELEKLKRDFEYNLVQERKQIRKETAEKFAERLKAMAYQSTDWSHGVHPMVVEVDYIDEICEEITDKGVQNGN